MAGQDRQDDERPLDILIVEDLEADYLLLQRELRKAGVLGRSARVDSSEALVAALDEDWDAVLSDFNVPGMDLRASLDLVKAHREDLPVILVSGSIGEEMAVELLRLGIQDFILKERLARLPSAIRRAVAGARERRARQLAESELRKLARAIEQSPENVVITDVDGNIEYVNHAFEVTTGYAASEVLGRNPRMLNQGDTPRQTYEQLWVTLGRGEVWKGEFTNARRDGSRYIESATIAPIRQPDGAITHYVAVKQDITEQRRTQALVHQLAYFDALTGLPNRARFRERLEAELASAAQGGGGSALLVLDIERFQFINDTMGYAAGDQMLREFAGRIHAGVAAGATIARTGGDEFAVLLPGVDDDAQALGQARQLAESLAQPYRLQGESAGEVRRAVRIGLCLFGPGDDSVDQVLKRAELALRSARAGRQQAVCAFDPAMQAEVDRRADLEAGLRQALDRGELLLYLQPQVDARGCLVGAEALLRWFRNGATLVGPDEFIALAEDTGLIVPIGQWVIGEACRLLRQWAGQAEQRGLTLAVNVSARQFHQPGFVSQLSEALQASGIDPTRLKLELTESVVLADLGYTLQRMREIRALGVSLALDDFGMGYSSLTYLKHLPFDELKIDRSFVHDMGSDPRSAAIVSAILAFARALGMDVVAEGVETEAQREMLRAGDCSLYQGYLFSQPMPVDDWLAYCREGAD